MSDIKKFDTEEFGKVMDIIAPLTLMESWDNSGFQIDLNNEIAKILVSLELTEKVVDEAIEMGADLILTHHPLFFNDLNNIMSSNFKGSMVVKLIQNNISLYSSHTPFDIVNGGNNDYLGKLLGVKNIVVLEDGFCRTGEFEMPVSVRNIAAGLSEKIGIDIHNFRLAGNEDDLISKVAWCTGSGTDFIDDAMESGCQLFITGDLKYHQAQDSLSKGIQVLDIGHFGSEIIFNDNATNLLKKIISTKGIDVEILSTEVDLNPFTVLK